MKLRRHRPLLLIDIAVPRNIEPEVNFLEDVYLYNIDDLQAIANDYLKQRQEEVARCETDHPREGRRRCWAARAGGIRAGECGRQLAVRRVACCVLRWWRDA